MPDDDERPLCVPEVAALLADYPYNADIVWARVDGPYGYDLYQVTGMEPTPCQPTLTLTWVETVSDY